MSAICELGTQVRVPDGREATVVYNSLIGVGIKWGLHDPDPADFEGTTGNTFGEDQPNDWPWEPEAILRNPELKSRLGLPCICRESDVEILRVGLHGAYQMEDSP